MTVYERIENLRREHKISQGKLEKELGFSNGSISKWKNSMPTPERLKKIADHFGVTVDYLMNGNETTQLLYTCPDCGFTYVPTEYTDAEYHIEKHNAWEKAVNKFGQLYCNGIENEKIKGINRNIRNDKNNPIKTRYDAELKVLRCLFSRSVEASNFNLQHVPFEQYVAMMLNNPKYLQSLDPELTQKLICDYGTLPGIKDGHSYYDVPLIKQQTLATHNITNAEYDQIKKYRDLDDHGKEMVDMVLDKEHTRVTATKVIPLSRPILNAAHERTDIEVTDEMRKHDDDIMMNDKLWE